MSAEKKETKKGKAKKEPKSPAKAKKKTARVGKPHLQETYTGTIRPKLMKDLEKKNSHHSRYIGPFVGNCWVGCYS